MPNTRLELIQYLCTLAGIIMEDTSGDAVSSISGDPEQRRMQLAELTSAASDINMMIAAAEVLNRRSDS